MQRGFVLAEGDLEKAIDILRKSGWQRALKKKDAKQRRLDSHREKTNSLAIIEGNGRDRFRCAKRPIQSFFWYDVVKQALETKPANSRRASFANLPQRSIDHCRSISELDHPSAWRKHPIAQSGNHP